MALESDIFGGGGGDYSKLEGALKDLANVSKESSSALMSHTKNLRDKMKLDLDGIKNVQDRMNAEKRYASLVKLTGKAMIDAGGDMQKFTKSTVAGMQEALRKKEITVRDVFSYGKDAISQKGKSTIPNTSALGSKFGSKFTSAISSASTPESLFKGIIAGAVGGITFVTDKIASLGKWLSDIGDKIAMVGKVIAVFTGGAGLLLVVLGSVVGAIGSLVGAIAQAIGQIAGFLGQIASMGIEIMFNWARIARKQLEMSNNYLKQVDSSGRTQTPNFMAAMSGADSVAAGHGLRGMLPEDLMREMTLFATQGMRAGFNGVTAESMTAGLAIKRGLLDGVSGFEEMANTETRYKGISMKATAGMLKVMQDGASKVGLSWQKIGNVFTSAVNEAAEFGIGQGQVGSMMKKLVSLDVELRNSGIDLNKKMGSIMKDLTTGTSKFGDGLTAFLGMKMGATDAFSGMTKARYGMGASWQQDSSGKFTMTGSEIKAGEAGLNMMRTSWKIMSESVRNKGLTGDAAMFQLKQMGKQLMPGIADATIEAIAVSGGKVLNLKDAGLSDEELIKSQMYSEKEIGIKLLTAGEHDAMIQRMMLQLQTVMFDAIVGVLNMLLIAISRLVVWFTGGTFFGKSAADLDALSKINGGRLSSTMDKISTMLPDIAKAAGISKESAMGMFGNLDTTAQLFSGKSLAVSSIAALPEKDLGDWRKSTADRLSQVKNTSTLGTLVGYSNPMINGLLEEGKKKDSREYDRLLYEAFSSRYEAERQHNDLMVSKYDKIIEGLKSQNRDTQNGPFKNN
jgi:hypothetical protein